MDQIVGKHNLKGDFINMDNITAAGKSQKEHDENVMKYLDVVSERKLSFNEGTAVLNTKSVKFFGY